MKDYSGKYPYVVELKSSEIWTPRMTIINGAFEIEKPIADFVEVCMKIGYFNGSEWSLDFTFVFSTASDRKFKIDKNKHA